MFRKRSPRPDPTPAIRQLPRPATGRVISAYRGQVLPGFIHTFRIEHLRPIAGERSPYKFFPDATHHLWILHRRQQAETPIMLFNSQYNLATLTTYEDWQTPDWIAFQVLRFLAGHVAADVVTGLRDPRLLRRIPDRRLEEQFEPYRAVFWDAAVAAKCRDLDRTQSGL